ncbi:MAG: lipocalin family protein [Dokdonella sp.]
MNFSKTLMIACMSLFTSGIAGARNLPPIAPVAKVDLARFMGDWYVIATIPTRFEKNAFNALETYTLQPNGEVATAFRFREGAFDGKLKEIDSTGFVKDGTGNAVWGVEVFWPIKAQYIVAYLKDDYSQTIIARDARDYLWVMARTPSVSQADYDALVVTAEQYGYRTADIIKVPQMWPAATR